ncbi:ROK family protein [Flavihumibacter sp. UBA7668]|uniref:ROK family protein n=1 Tax=Flavihumibacter sp. UBA7668 TaxID=1946542 RepID=UPI0025C51D57|nr:ROK family protein [Flavihumibacter sp. UBA7668]
MAGKSDLYKSKILKELCLGNLLSGSDISIRIERSLPLTLRVLNELVQEGMVEEKGYAASTGGRRPLMYALAPGKMYGIAIAMDQLITRIALIDLQSFGILDTRKLNLRLKNNEDALQQLIQHIRSFISELTIDPEKIIGIGIGMPGFIDVNKGINYSYLDNNGDSISQRMEEEIGIPVYIDNDSSVIALAEFKLGGAKNKSNAMVINVSWGVGLGMIVNGELFRGYNGFSGEFSHIPIFNNNKLCECGKNGCLETEASLRVVVDKARQGISEGRVTSMKHLPEEIEEACHEVLKSATRGDQFAVELLSEAAMQIGKGIAILIHIMNPELIILSGRGAAAGNLWLPPIQQALNRYCIPRLAAYTHMEISRLSKEAELMGAASLVVENIDKPQKPTPSIPAHPFVA